MSKVIRFESSLDIFQNIVLLYRNDEGKLYIGNVYYYNGQGKNDYLGIFCKDPLPEDKGIIMGWNWLDDNSPYITMVPESDMETGVEDFMFANGRAGQWNSVDYHVVNSYGEIDEYVEKHPIAKGEIAGFGIEK